MWDEIEHSTLRNYFSYIHIHLGPDGAKHYENALDAAVLIGHNMVLLGLVSYLCPDSLLTVC